MVSFMERWLPIARFENSYEVSDLGRVRSLARVVRQGNRDMRIQARILQPWMRNGYPCVTLVGRREYVHRLVLLAFRGEPAASAEACHNNGIRTDNRLENLRWDDHTGNVGDAIDHGTFCSIGVYNGDKTHCHRGHPFNEVNTLIRPTGRSCRECIRINERARYHRRKGFVRGQ